MNPAMPHCPTCGLPHRDRSKVVRFWTHADVVTARRMRAEGKRYRQIAEQLARSEAAVYMKLKELSDA